MPVQSQFPGVYIEEAPAGVRTIARAPTSIAAFAGWAVRGPVSAPTPCSSWADFQAIFGGLDTRSLLGYAVSQFFSNGGAQCLIVRLAHPDATSASAAIDGLEVAANSPGGWANIYSLVSTPAIEDANRFRLDIRQGPAGTMIESFANLSLDPAGPRFAGRVINGASRLVTVVRTDPAQPVTAASADLTGGADIEVIGPGDAVFDDQLMGDSASTGAYSLNQSDIFNMLNVPGYANTANLAKLQAFCRVRRAMLLVDSGQGTKPQDAPLKGPPDAVLSGADSCNAAYYYPWLMAPDPLQTGISRPLPPCGAVAGIYGRTDVARGVWKSPSGTEADIYGVAGPTLAVTDLENGLLNPLAVNCIRALAPHGTLVWGARTLQGGDAQASQWKYVPVRRTALFIEESLIRGLGWVASEPNSEACWAQIRLAVDAFMNDLFRSGAFQGAAPKDAYFVKCDAQTTTQSDTDEATVNILVGFAPLKPAEFVVLTLNQPCRKAPGPPVNTSAAGRALSLKRGTKAAIKPIPASRLGGQFE